MAWGTLPEDRESRSPARPAAASCGLGPRAARLKIAGRLAASAATACLLALLALVACTSQPGPGPSTAPALSTPARTPRPSVAPLSAGPQAAGTVRYVSPTGADQGACATPAAACRTPQYAVDQAAAGDEVWLAGGTYQGASTRAGLTQALVIAKNVTVRGGWDAGFSRADPAANPSTLNPGGLGQALVITGTVAPTVTGLRLTGGKATYGGGLYLVAASATISNCQILNNSAGFGGGVYLSGGQPALLANTISNNTATWHGGGVYLAASPASFVNNVISNNNAQQEHGGGLYLARAAARFSHDTISGNRAGAGDGGGLYLLTSAAALDAPVVTGNSAHNGAGLYANGSPFTLTAGTVATNTASLDGGGIYLADSNAAVSGSVVAGNQAQHSDRGGGGGIFASAGQPVLTDNQVTGNTGLYGGGVYLERGIYTLRNNRVGSNSAWASGGGIFATGASEGGLVTVAGNTVERNQAVAAGGGLYLYNMTAVTLTQNTVQTNTVTGDSANVPGYGGGLFLNRGPAQVIGNRFLGNRATAGFGGGVYLDLPSTAPQVRLSSNTIAGNAAASAGGGLFQSGGRADLNATVLSGNQATGQFGAGGGLYALGGTASLSNMLLAGNSAGAVGSGAYFDGTTARLWHATIVANQGGDGSGLSAGQRWAAGGASVALTNTIVAAQKVGINVAGGSSARLESTLWGAGAWANQSNTGGTGSATAAHTYSADPGFVAPGAGDYHLARDSAAIDRGVVSPVTTDLDGRSRPYKAAPDLGAYEWYPSRADLPVHVFLPFIARGPAAR